MRKAVYIFFMLLVSPVFLVNTYGFESKNISGAKSQEPNVIIVLSDDQGYGDFSCHGNPILKTSALDAIYEESIRFTNFHVAPLCTPTRGQLISGVDAMRNKAATVLTARNILDRKLITMPEIFQANGYATGLFGKWHLGDSYPDRPMDKGFEKCIWHKGWGLLSEIEFDNDYYETRYLDSLDTRQSHKYCTNLWFDKAMEWMDEMVDHDRPFFTYLSLNAPHGPFHAQMQDYKMFKDQVEGESVASFLGMIRNIDRNMQRLEDWLMARGIKENTIIIFMNDNGGTGGVEVYNAGMRGKKGSNYDGGHRAACFLRWPNGAMGPARSIDHGAQIQDILPTLIDLLDLKISGRPQFDGRSLKPMMLKGEHPHRMFVVQYGGHVRPEKYFGCVVWDQWRLVGRDELYDINKDPGQQTNVAEANPKILKEMRGFYEQWWNGVKDGVDQFVPIIIGAEEENPVTFHSANWEDGAVNTQWAVAQAKGEPRGGTTHINVVADGMYRIYLSRWPLHLNLPLTAEGPEAAVGGSWIRKGQSLPIYKGGISIDGTEPVMATGQPNAASIIVESKLSAGDHSFKAWFQDEVGNAICGAYYVKIEKLK